MPRGNNGPSKKGKPLPRWPDADEQKLVRLFADGMSVKVIAVELDRTYEAVRRKLSNLQKTKGLKPRFGRKERLLPEQRSVKLNIYFDPELLKAIRARVSFSKYQSVPEYLRALARRDIGFNPLPEAFQRRVTSSTPIANNTIKSELEQRMLKNGTS